MILIPDVAAGTTTRTSLQPVFGGFIVAQKDQNRNRNCPATGQTATGSSVSIGSGFVLVLTTGLQITSVMWLSELAGVQEGSCKAVRHVSQAGMGQGCKLEGSPHYIAPSPPLPPLSPSLPQQFVLSRTLLVVLCFEGFAQGAGSRLLEFPGQSEHAACFPFLEMLHVGLIAGLYLHI